MITIEKESKDPNNMTVAEIAFKYTPWSWEEAFEYAKPELEQISRKIEEQIKLGKTIYPKKEHIFKAFHYTPLHKVNVIIIGQDPYSEPIAEGHSISLVKDDPRAQGLSYGVSKRDVIPPSLNNIFKELKNEYIDYQIPVHGDLTQWASQGVLLLNSCLSVNAYSAGSHKAIWSGFLEKILKRISAKNPKVIVLLWGRQLQDIIKPLLDDSCIVLEAGHPSSIIRQQFNVKKKSDLFKSFIGCGHFQMVNEILVKQGKKEINWQLALL